MMSIYRFRFNRLSRSLTLAMIPGVVAISGCDAIKDHVELGAIEMKLEKVDPAKNTLEAMPSPAVKRSGANIEGQGGKLLILQGLNTVPEIAPEVEIFDPAARTYSNGAPWPKTDISAESILRGTDEICIRLSVDLATKLDCYNMTTNAWTTLPLFPNKEGVNIGTVGSDIYGFGISADDIGKVYKFDAAASAWKNVANYPGTCDPKLARSIGTELYVLPCADTSPLYKYDPATDMWTTMPLPADENAKIAQHTFVTTGTAVVGDELLIYNHNASKTGPVLIFNPKMYDMTMMKSGFRFSAPRPDLGFEGQAVTATSKELWVAVYDDSKHVCGAIHSYDPATDAWTLRVTRPTDDRACGGAIGAVGDDVFVLTSLQDREVKIN